MDQLSFEFRTPAEENNEIKAAVRKIEESINKLSNRISFLNEQKNEILSQTRVDCPSCKESFAIYESEYIQTHWYTPPRGCSGGDYWNKGEGNCICPHCQSRLRLYKVPEIEKLKYQFKSVRDEYEG